MPSASDFAAILRVCECAAWNVEMVEDDLELLLLQKKLKKAEAINSDLEADLMDREDKLSCCNNDFVPDLIEENRFLRNFIASLSNAEAEIAAVEGLLAARVAEVERVTASERDLAEARRQEEEAKNALVDLQNQARGLESELLVKETEIAGATSEGFLRARDLLLVLDPEVDLEFFDEENEVLDGKIIHRKEGGGTETLYDPSEDEEE